MLKPNLLAKIDGAFRSRSCDTDFRSNETKRLWFKKCDTGRGSFGNGQSNCRVTTVLYGCLPFMSVAYTSVVVLLSIVFVERRGKQSIKRETQERRSVILPKLGRIPLVSNVKRCLLKNLLF